MITTDHHVKGRKQKKKPVWQKKKEMKRKIMRERMKGKFHWPKKNRRKQIGSKIMVMQADKSTLSTSFPTFRPNVTRERMIAVIVTAMLIT